MTSAPVVLLNCVGLTRRWLPHAPRLSALAKAGAVHSLKETLPAVTCATQASMLTGRPPREHGIVANGWLYPDTREVRFWQQSNSLLEAEPIYVTLRRLRAAHGRPFTCAKLFWWFNQGAKVDVSLTPKPHYACDGSKVFGISGTPEGLTDEIQRSIGAFPFHTFWGPKAGKGCTEWIARASAWILERHRCDLTLVYLPYLDYDPQRFGPSGCDMAKLVAELDNACEPLLDACRRQGARVWVVSEYGHCDVEAPVYLNREFRKRGLLSVRRGPFGEMLDTFESRAIAVCDHQIAHIYVRDVADVGLARDAAASTPGVAEVLVGNERARIELDHPRSGQLIALSDKHRWFAYPYWLDDKLAPDFARTVDIHRKPGFDPCEMFFDPNLKWPMLRAARRLVQKKLGFRMRMDVIGLDASIVKGSHGLPADDALDRPILIVDEPTFAPSSDACITEVQSMLLHSLAGEGT